MALRYTKFQSEFKVDVVGEVALTAGPDNLKVIDLTTVPFKHGFHYIAFVLQNCALTGVASLTAEADDTIDGTGTADVIQTMSLPIDADGEHVLEIPSHLLSHAQDRSANNSVYKSLTLRIDGTNLDTVDLVVVTKAMQEQESLTPADVTVVS